MNHLLYTEGHLLAKTQIKSGDFISAHSTLSDIKNDDPIWFNEELQWKGIILAVKMYYKK